MMNEVLTCYICTYNRAQYLKDQIDSVLKQTYKEFQLVILDNASEDETKDVVTSYDDARIQYIRHEKNIGGLANIRYAFEHCTSKYLIILHDDDFCDETLFEREVMRLEEDDALAFVSANAMGVDENRRSIGVMKTGTEDRFYEKFDYFEEYFINNRSLIFPTIMYRNEFMKQNHLFILEEPGPCADVVLISDIFRCGGKGLELCEPLIYYRRHEGQDSMRNFAPMHVKLYRYFANEARFADGISFVRDKKDLIWKKRNRQWIAYQITEVLSPQDVAELAKTYGTLLGIDEKKIKQTVRRTSVIKLFRLPLKIAYKLYGCVRG